MPSSRMPKRRRTIREHITASVTIWGFGVCHRSTFSALFLHDLIFALGAIKRNTPKVTFAGTKLDARPWSFRHRLMIVARSYQSHFEAIAPLRGGWCDAMLPLLSLAPGLVKPRRDDGHVTPAIPGLGSGRKRGGTRRTFENRYQQLPSDKPVRLAWVDKPGQVRCVPGRCIDISSRRIHIEVPVTIPLHTLVMLRADGIGIAGSAAVKHVTSCGDAKFILVLETN